VPGASIGAAAGGNAAGEELERLEKVRWRRERRPALPRTRSNTRVYVDV